MMTSLAVQHLVFTDSGFATWSDEALVACVMRSQNSQNQAINVLLSRHHSWIVQRCRFRLNNKHDAQDVAQQVAIRVYRSIAQLKEPAGFKAWLGRIVDNCCNTYAVQRARYFTSDCEQQLDLYVAEEIHELKQLEDKEVVAQVFAQLTDAARQVLALRFFEERSLEQIAQQLHVKLSAAKARLYRALAQFKEIYLRLVD